MTVIQINEYVIDQVTAQQKRGVSWAFSMKEHRAYKHLTALNNNRNKLLEIARNVKTREEYLNENEKH